MSSDGTCRHSKVPFALLKKKPQHCSGWFVVWEKHCSGWKNKLKKTNYKRREQNQNLLVVIYSNSFTQMNHEVLAYHQTQAWLDNYIFNVVLIIFFSRSAAGTSILSVQEWGSKKPSRHPQLLKMGYRRRKEYSEVRLNEISASKAGIAQLGERQTEDLKVACSIHAHRRWFF